MIAKVKFNCNLCKILFSNFTLTFDFQLKPFCNVQIKGKFQAANCSKNINGIREVKDDNLLKSIKKKLYVTDYIKVLY